MLCSAIQVSAPTHLPQRTFENHTHDEAEEENEEKSAYRAQDVKD
jgi:hypothetical protein